MSDNGPDQWKQSAELTIEDLQRDRDSQRRETLRLEERMAVIEKWRLEHMSVCHPAILTWQGKIWNKWLMVSGIVGGFCLVVGYVLGKYFDLWGK